MVKFLQDELGVPKENIKFLVDASKNNIIAALKSLYSPDSRVKKNDLILIYFAGHGARCEAPEGWRPGTKDNKIEMICPVDIGCEIDGRIVTGIPDFILGSLITSIAEEKGDNIVSPSPWSLYCKLFSDSVSSLCSIAATPAMQHEVKEREK